VWLESAEPSGGTGVFGFQLMYPPECDEYTSQVRLRTRPSDAEREYLSECKSNSTSEKRWLK